MASRVIAAIARLCRRSDRIGFSCQGGSTFDPKGTLLRVRRLRFLTNQDAPSDTVGFALFAACSTSLKCSIAAVRLLRRW